MLTDYLSDGDHFLNPEAIKLARAYMASVKQAFVPGSDPGMMSGMPPGGAPPPGGGAPPPGGGMPMDPSMMGGAPPGGGAPPPPAGGGGNSDELRAIIRAELQAAGGAGGAGGAQGLKPKIDVNVALMQISKMMARIADSLGIQIPASEMIATPTDLNQMAANQQQAQDPANTSAIAPIDPVQAMGGVKPSDKSAAAFDTNDLLAVSRRAAAIRDIRAQRDCVA